MARTSGIRTSVRPSRFTFPEEDASLSPISPGIRDRLFGIASGQGPVAEIAQRGLADLENPQPNQMLPSPLRPELSTPGSSGANATRLRTGSRFPAPRPILNRPLDHDAAQRSKLLVDAFKSGGAKLRGEVEAKLGAGDIEGAKGIAFAPPPDVQSKGISLEKYDALVREDARKREERLADKKLQAAIDDREDRQAHSEKMQRQSQAFTEEQNNINAQIRAAERSGNKAEAERLEKKGDLLRERENKARLAARRFDAATNLMNNYIASKAEFATRREQAMVTGKELPDNPDRVNLIDTMRAFGVDVSQNATESELQFKYAALLKGLVAEQNDLSGGLRVEGFAPPPSAPAAQSPSEIRESFATGGAAQAPQAASQPQHLPPPPKGFQQPLMINGKNDEEVKKAALANPKQPFWTQHPNTGDMIMVHWTGEKWGVIAHAIGGQGGMFTGRGATGAF